MYSRDASKLSFHELSIRLFAALSWYVITDGNFQDELKVRASSDIVGRTKKSLKRCHWLSPGAEGRECATAKYK